MALNVGSSEEAEAMSDINVTPLVDVMLVLLIIFIITIRVIIQQVPVELPKATNLPTQTKPENITIAVDKQGDIYWNTKLLTGTDDLKNAAARHRAQWSRSRKCTFAAMRTFGTSSWARCSWPRSRSAFAKWRSSPPPITSVPERRREQDGHECRRSSEGQSYSDINMTPLIDVMLVLLIIFIITIPSMTHAVKIDNPLPPPPNRRRRRRK